VTVDYWKTAASGDWNTASNWTDGLPGSNGDGQVIGPAGTYTLTLSSAGSSALSLLMIAAGATFSETSTGTLNLGDQLILQAGTAILRNANTIANGVNLQGGLLETSNAGALGSGAFTISGGEFVGLSTETVANALNMSGAFTIAAATGTTLTLNGAPGWSLDTSTTINFGDATNKGTVVWYTPGGSIVTLPASSTVEVHGGTTLKSGGGGLAGLLGSVSATTVDAGATIDVNGFSTSIKNLTGQGVVTDSGAANNLVIHGAGFAGAITGPLVLEFGGDVVLSGTNTYTGGTTIDAGANLGLGADGTTGSIIGNIVDNGALFIQRSNTVTLDNAILGTGELRQVGGGTTVINHANSYSGGTTLSAGILQIGNSGALGTAGLTIHGGELVASASESVANKLTMSGNFTIAAATGKVLTLDSTSAWTLASNSTVNFGDATNKGTVVWYTPTGSTIGSTVSTEVHGGTLKAGDSEFNFLIMQSGTVTVDAGATIDTNGFDATVIHLQGLGAVTNSGAAALLQLGDTNFAGQINGALSLMVDGTVTLSGGGNFTGGVNITPASTLNLAGTTPRTVTFGGDGMLSLSNAAHVAGTLNITTASGANDIVTGGAGDDTFAFGASLQANDTVNGGAGTDTVTLNGNYSAGLTFTGTTMVNVEKLTLAAGHSYKLITNNATVASGQTLTVNGSALGTGNVLTFNGAAETNGNFVVMGGAGADAITGGAGSDTINPGLGNDTVNAGAGNDTINLVGSLTVADKVDGGAGTDTVVLNGNYAAGVTFSATTMVNVEKLTLAAGHSYKLTTNNATVSSGQTLTVNGSALSASDVLTFNGAAETNGHFIIIGGNGADKLTGGALSDTFTYTSAAQSTGTHYDTITGFKFGTDIFDIPGGAGTITGINTKVTSGALSTATFDANLTSAISSSHLGAHHAVLFTPTSGTLSGVTFLIVDLNGVAGYQSGHDLVIRMNGATGTLAAGGFH